MTTQWTRWLVVASAMAAMTLGFVAPTKADEFLKKEKGYGPLPTEVREAVEARESVKPAVEDESTVNAREITFTASPNPYRYNRYRRYRAYRPVFVQPYYSGYNPYGGYNPYFVPSNFWPPLPAPFSYDTFHPVLGY
jgi:hypothetical protein